MTDPNELCISILKATLYGVVVSTEMPPERPKGFYVQVSRTGGDENAFLDRPIMTFMCWGTTDKDAYSLALDCVHALASAAESDEYLSKSELITISRDEWSANGQSRYIAEVKLTINKD